MKGWIPSTYKIVKKGIIINHDGDTSPQVDILILKESYPEKLLNKKHYIAAGVVAAFECKTTLKADHIEKAVKTSSKIKNLYEKRDGTPYQELYAPIIYGLLAHSHSWKNPKSTPKDNVENSLRSYDMKHVTHPRECLDLLCIADLATWTLCKDVVSFISRPNPADSNFDRFKFMTTGYIKRKSKNDETGKNTPIGDLISSLTRQLAWENHDLRDISNYYWFSGVTSGGNAYYREWNSSEVYSEKLLQDIRSGKLVSTNLFYWNEWQQNFGFP